MAKVQSNLVLHGLSGMIGKQLVVRRNQNGTFTLAAAPAPNRHAPSPAQVQQHEAFRQAVSYAKGAQSKPEYEALAKSRHVSPYNVAVADFLHAPEIRDIDIASYTGAIGQTIQIRAVDDVKVTIVGVLIATDTGVLVEKGTAVASTDDAAPWVYTTTAVAQAGAVKIVVDVADLAGHITEETKHT